MDATQRYELIRPILHHEKTPSQVHEETGVPLSTLYDYLKRFREGGEQIESLADRSNAPKNHPNWLTETQKQIVVAYRQQHPHKSARQIAEELTEADIVSINYHSVADILNAYHVPAPFLTTSLLN